MQRKFRSQGVIFYRENMSFARERKKVKIFISVRERERERERECVRFQVCFGLKNLCDFQFCTF